MSSESDAPRDTDGDAGATTQPTGTAVPVDFAADPTSRLGIALLLAGPTVWIVHFLLVYLVAEAGCTGSGTGLTLFDPPVPRVTTLVATVVAVAVCAWLVVVELRRFRAGPRDDADPTGAGDPGAVVVDDMGPDEARSAIDLAGLLLAAVSLISILFTAAPALVLGC